MSSQYTAVFILDLSIAKFKAGNALFEVFSINHKMVIKYLIYSWVNN